MTSKTVTLYRCDHCGKNYQREHACAQHEPLCSKNPANYRPCFDCHHLCKRKLDLHFDTWAGESVKEVEVLYCTAKNEAVYTPQTELKGNAYDFGDLANQPMPKTCDLYKLRDWDAYKESYEDRIGTGFDAPNDLINESNTAH